MSGVVDNSGQQWERTNCCGKFVRFPQSLGYERPTPDHPYGRSLCVTCTDAGIRAGTIDFDDITPAPEWVTVEVTA